MSRPRVHAVVIGATLALFTGACGGSPPSQQVGREEQLGTCLTVVLAEEEFIPGDVSLAAFNVPEPIAMSWTKNSVLAGSYGFDSALDREAWLGADGELQHNIVFGETYQEVQSNVVVFDDAGNGVVSWDRPSQTHLEQLEFKRSHWYRPVIVLADGSDLVAIEAVGPPVEVC